jgi:hypothetical protein
LVTEESDWLERARELRAEAWDAVQASADFIAFKKFDDLVVGMGGATAIPEINVSSSWKSTAKRAIDAAARRVSEAKKVSQGDAAELALIQARCPLGIGKLLKASISLGAEIRGADPLANFRSAVSKDARFFTIKRDGHHFWWVCNAPIPADWEAIPIEVLVKSTETGGSDSP